MHPMATHQEIIQRAGAAAIRDKLGLPNIHTVRSWAQRNRIPAEWWPELAAAGVATLDELRATARPRKNAGRKAESQDAA